MRHPTPTQETVFTTKWFSIAAKTPKGGGDPHYVLQTNDFVAMVAVDLKGRLLLVRQFRAAAEQVTLELPSGHVEEGETPEEAARKELLEETGHVADEFELVGKLSPCIGRYQNRAWCYFVRGARPTDDPAHRLEEGVEPVFYGGSVSDLVREEEFLSSLSVSALMLAVAEKRLTV